MVHGNVLPVPPNDCWTVASKRVEVVESQLTPKLKAELNIRRGGRGLVAWMTGRKRLRQERAWARTRPGRGEKVWTISMEPEETERVDAVQSNDKTGRQGEMTGVDVDPRGGLMKKART